MTTVVLILLCLAIAGRELYMAYDRRRPGDSVAYAEIADIRRQVAELKASRDELREELKDELQSEFKKELSRRDEALQEADSRIRSLISQINDRMLPEINAQLAEQGEATDRLRRHVRRRLDQAVAASLGADPVDTVSGVLGGEVRSAEQVSLTEAYEQCALAYGLDVELADPGGDDPWQVLYYLTGPSPRELERDFIDLLRALREGLEGTGPVHPLLKGLRGIEAGVAQLGPLVVVRTPEALLCGVQPLAELLHREPSALFADPAAVAVRLRSLPESRFCDLSTWRPQALTA